MKSSVLELDLAYVVLSNDSIKIEEAKDFFFGSCNSGSFAANGLDALLIVGQSFHQASKYDKMASK